MKKVYLAAIALAVAFFASCGGSKENKTEDLQVEATDSIVEEPAEVLFFPSKIDTYISDDVHTGAFTLKYDDQNRLVELLEGKDLKASITYGDNEITQIENDVPYIYKYTDGKVSECRISHGEDEVIVNYVFDGENIKEESRTSCNSKAVCTTKYKWDNNCVAEKMQTNSYNGKDVSSEETTYVRSDIRNSFTIDVMSIISEWVDAASLCDGFSSEFLPSEETSVSIAYSTDNRSEVHKVYEYTLDDQGRIVEIKINVTTKYSKPTDTETTEFVEKRTVKLFY